MVKIERRHFEHFWLIDVVEIAVILAIGIWAHKVFPEWVLYQATGQQILHWVIPFASHIPNDSTASMVIITFLVDLCALAAQTFFFYNDELRDADLNGPWTQWRKEELKCFAMGALLAVSFVRMLTWKPAWHYVRNTKKHPSSDHSALLRGATGASYHRRQLMQGSADQHPDAGF